MGTRALYGPRLLEMLPPLSMLSLHMAVCSLQPFNGSLFALVYVGRSPLLGRTDSSGGSRGCFPWVMKSLPRKLGRDEVRCKQRAFLMLTGVCGLPRVLRKES